MRARTPRRDLIRATTGSNEAENIWVAKRQLKRNEVLEKRLEKIDESFFAAYEHPRSGVANSDGGYRSLIIDAGVASKV